MLSGNACFRCGGDAGLLLAGRWGGGGAVGGGGRSCSFIGQGKERKRKEKKRRERTRSVCLLQGLLNRGLNKGALQQHGRIRDGQWLTAARLTVRSRGSAKGPITTGRFVAL